MMKNRTTSRLVHCSRSRGPAKRRATAGFITTMTIALLIAAETPALGQAPATESVEQGATPLDQMEMANPQPAQPLVPAGTILHNIQWHDNTPSNPRAMDPKNWVGDGQRTIDEMGFAWIGWYDMTDDEYKAELEARKAERAKKANTTQQQQQQQQ